MEVTGDTQLDGTLTVTKNTTLNGDVNQIGNADGSSTSNTLTAKNNTMEATGGKNTIKASETNDIVGGKGNNITATTGNNVITANGEGFNVMENGDSYIANTHDHNEMGTTAEEGYNRISATGKGGYNELEAADYNGIGSGNEDDGYNTIEVFNTKANDGVVVNAIGTENGVVMNGGVNEQTGNATMVLSGTRAALTASTGTGLDINGATADTTTLSGGTSKDTASTVTLADNRASVMTYGGNGMWADASSANLTGGGNTLSMSSSGARFSNASGGPVKVTGVANGTSRYDAVNYGQLQDVERLASRGIASVTAMANIPQVEPGKTFAVGAGIGSYNGYQALSIGASGRIFDGLVVKAAVGSSENGHAAFGGGVSYSW